MTQVTLTFSVGDDGAVTRLTGQFSDDDLALLEKYVDAVARVRATTLLQRGLPGITSIKWTPSGLEFGCEPYADSEIHELLHVLRRVMLYEEPASFEKVVARLGRVFQDRGFSDYLKVLKATYDHGELRSYMQITIAEEPSTNDRPLSGGQPLFDQSVLRIWLNGEEYHTDADKAAAWQKLAATLQQENARALVIDLIYSRVKVLFLVEGLAQAVLSKRG